jgi:NAD(P) transhydrogenase subunit beta
MSGSIMGILRSVDFIQSAYLVAAILFILGLRNLSSPKTAVMGNFQAAMGMLVAIVATLLDASVVSYGVIVAGIVVGALIGSVLAMRIEMTAMPQMVALLNGFGGAASALVAGAELLGADATGTELAGGIVPFAVVASVLIGSITLTGSLVAFAKLQELVGGGAVTYPGQQFVNGALGTAVLAAGATVVMNTGNFWRVVNGRGQFSAMV